MMGASPPPPLPDGYTYATARTAGRGQAHRRRLHVTEADPKYGWPNHTALCGARPKSGMVTPLPEHQRLNDVCERCEARLPAQPE